MYSFIAVFVLLLSFSSVQAQTAQDIRQGALPPNGDMQPLAAEFEARIVLRPGRPAEKTRWYFLREPHRIETLRPSGRVAEIWERDARGEISLRRVFQADRRIVEYTSGELKARRNEPSWTVLRSILNPATLARLKQTGRRQVRGGNATVYKGMLQGEQMEIWWLEHLSLPARLQRHSATGQFTLTLQALHTQVPQSWPRVSAADLRDYLSIDAADFGDMEHDPFVRKVQKLDAETRRLDHASHHGRHAH